MIPLFLDTDMILDVFAERQPFYHDSARLLTLVEEHHVIGYTSSLIFANLYYILRRLRSRDAALTYLHKLRSLVTVLAVDAQTIDEALHAAFTDFEDAIQYHTALRHQITYLITRNTDDYHTADPEKITICTPTEYLVLWDASHRKYVQEPEHRKDHNML
jgi:predicted nucleic acid-binding protein